MDTVSAEQCSGNFFWLLRDDHSDPWHPIALLVVGEQNRLHRDIAEGLCSYDKVGLAYINIPHLSGYSLLRI